MLKLQNNDSETEKTILELLSKNITLENKKTVIEKVNIVITDFSKVDSDLWDTFIRCSKVELNWFNIDEYYKKFGYITDDLTKYLNYEEHYQKLAKDQLNIS